MLRASGLQKNPTHRDRQRPRVAAEHDAAPAGQEPGHRRPASGTPGGGNQASSEARPRRS